ncbi:Fatty acid desaturase, type 2 [Fimbriimonadaceae bacterium]|jgi:acyl-[acyl-carrier-protein] desaturase
MTQVNCYKDEIVPRSLVQWYEDNLPSGPVGNYSIQERWLCLERCLYGLYRWYTEKSQRARNWNPDTSIEWSKVRTDHTEEFNTILRGFYAVEQYIPDYVSEGLKMFRQSYGRVQFHLRWGAEEERHSDLWRNSLIFTKAMTTDEIEEYSYNLRGQQWHLPWEDPIHMFFYTVFQERATQINYLNLGLVAKGNWNASTLTTDYDPVFVDACRFIAMDESAHYAFFLEGCWLLMYFFPERATEVCVEVLRHFAMPARHIIPDYDEFATILHKSAIFGMRQYSRDVAKVALEALGIDDLKAVEAGIRASRRVPEVDGEMRPGAVFEGFDYEKATKKANMLWQKIAKYEEGIQVPESERTSFLKLIPS